MTADHYATLGVAPTSEVAAIRAAYLALMRQYHPDRNASAEAAERTRAITHAYAVLSDWDRRAEYDLMLARKRSLDAFVKAPRRRRPPSPSAVFAMAAVGLLLLVAIRPPAFISEQAGRLPTAPVRQAAAPKPDRVADCSTPETREAIKQELFRQAARIRGSDEAAFDRLAGHALIRIDSPELREDDDGSARCRAVVALDLPPGVAVLGGRRTLTADVDYSVGRNAVRLSNEGLIVTPLATLAQVGQPAEDPAPPPVIDPQLAEAPPPIVQRPPVARPSPAPPRARVAPQLSAAPARIAPQRAAAATQPRPSFSCRIAKGRGETAVCKNADLARLDRHLGMLYGQSWGQADAARREKLLGTRDGFIARRDACRSDSCISAAYIGRMREISDIMSAK